MFKDLNKISEPPFAVFFKNEERYLLSASPERYLRKEGSKVISQPIKGTARRSTNSDEDLEIAKVLENDTKERSENIMIVDLVRNDLSKTAKKGSVHVEELCKVYSFKQVHQMISTVVSKIHEDTHCVDVIRDTFPMGSMTGAPKISAMKIIEELEETTIKGSGVSAFDALFPLIFSKLYDEYITPDDGVCEFRTTSASPKDQMKKIVKLFSEAKKEWSGIFKDNEFGSVVKKVLSISSILLSILFELFI